jgi:aryl-alcohol dehydrogenase-like predicted oxidoreductase
MIALEEISRVGFGAHLVTDERPDHFAALSRALQLGCNLIDTSANYMGGASERLIGRVLASRPDRDAFVITKSGYDEAEQLPLVESGAARDNFLHPDFLANRIGLSLGRLQRSRLDGYLLHSPEAFLEQRKSAAGRDEFYARLRLTFEFLESRVAAGVIRYYGLSSNTIPQPLDDLVTIDLRRVMDVAGSVSTEHHFKLLEFPYNFAETGATADQHGDGSLLSIAKAHRLVTFSNRPLNAKTADGAVRLAEYEIAPPADCGDAFAPAQAAIARQLAALGASDDAMDFPVIKFLSENWSRIGNPEAVEDMFRSHVDPFLAGLYGGAVPSEEAVVYVRLYQAASAASVRIRAERTGAFRRELEATGSLSPPPGRPLPVLACEAYLARGIDHVLVGMRRPDYVDELRGFFSRGPPG